MTLKQKKTYFLMFLCLVLLFTAILVREEINNSQESVTNIKDISFTSATWTLNGVVISSLIGSQENPAICLDGNGGSIIAWQDWSGSTLQIYAQRINATGHVQWATNGIRIAPTSYHQYEPQICSDGQGGAIIVWQDERAYEGIPNICAQRLNASGVKQWGSTGVEVFTSVEWQMRPRIISDGANGAIILWQRLVSGNYYLYGQRLSAAGAKQWGSIKAIYTAGTTDTFEICSDGSGGAYITWCWGDVFAQRINSAGNCYWNANGVQICNASATQEESQIIKDGTNSAVIVWQDWRAAPNADVYAQRINETGDIQWAFNGVAVGAAGSYQRYPTLCSDGGTGSYITWKDERVDAGDIYAQRLNASGQAYWTANGIPICTTSSQQDYPRITSDGVGGAIMVWQQGDIYAQRINESGHTLWPANGTAICSAGGVQSDPAIVCDGAEGAYIAWNDYRSDSWGNMYAYRAMVPDDPTLQTITPSVDTDGIIQLNWTECVGAASYYIYRDTSTISSVNGLTPIKITSNTNYDDTIPVNGDYYYVIVAGNRVANSSMSNCENVTASITPAAPTLDAITPAVDPDGVISLNWSDEIAVTNYYVYRNTSLISFNISGLNPIAATSNSNYTDTITSNGVYYYAIVSENNLGNSTSPSNCQSVTVAIPSDAPILDPIVPPIDSDGTIDLNWSDVVNATLYYIYREASNITGTGGLTPIDSVIDSNYTDVIGANGFYYYAIVADNGWANSSISNCENVTVAIPIDAADLDLITPSIDPDGNIALNWNDVVNATLYYIYRNVSSIVVLDGLTPIDTSITSNYTDTLTVNGMYYYVIVATDGWANSSISNCENVTIAIPPTIAVLDPITPLINTVGNITLNWNDVANATLYYVYRNTSEIVALDGITPIAVVTNSSYTENITTIGQYFYVIVVTDGWANSSISNCENVTVGIPTILSLDSPAESKTGIISLSWTAVDGATIYYLYRATSDITFVDALTPIANTNLTSYQDTLDESGTYFYVVVAGNNQLNATISNSVSVTVNLGADPGNLLFLVFLFPAIGIVIAIIVLYRRRGI